MRKNITLACILFVSPLFILLNAQQYRSEIIETKNEIKVEDNKITSSDTIRFQINNRMGANDSEMVIFYNKGDKISIGESWIEDMDGNIIRKLSKKDIIDHSAISNFSLYEDHFVRRFNLIHNTFPYRIVYTYRVTYNRFSTLAYLRPFSSRIPIRRGEIKIYAPPSREIKYTQKNIEPPTIDTIAKEVAYKWEYEYHPEKEQVFSSTNSNNSPFLHVVPLDFNIGVKANNKSWIDVGSWIINLNKGRDILPQSEKEKVEQLTSQTNDEREKIKILYQYLQDNTRYVNVSIKIGGQQTYPAQYVCTNRYGDCKALSNYMQAMLKHINIQSHYTLIHADENIADIDPAFPSDRFNHIILTVPLKNDTIFLECTANNIPMGYMGTGTQNRYALLVKENESQLVKTPALSPHDVLTTRKIAIELANAGSATVSMNTTERGYDYEFANSLMNSVNKNVVDKYLRNTIFSGLSELIDYKLEKHSRDSAYINMDIKCISNNMHKLYGNNLILSPLPFNTPSLEKPMDRTLDVQIDYPTHHQDTIIYKLEALNITKLPDDIDIKSPFGDEYHIKFSLRNNILEIDKKLLILSKRISVEQYPDFFKFIETVKASENQNIYLETSQKQ